MKVVNGVSFESLVVTSIEETDTSEPLVFSTLNEKLDNDMFVSELFLSETTKTPFIVAIPPAAQN